MGGWEGERDHIFSEALMSVCRMQHTFNQEHSHSIKAPTQFFAYPNVPTTRVELDESSANLAVPKYNSWKGEAARVRAQDGMIAISQHVDVVQFESKHLICTITP